MKDNTATTNKKQPQYINNAQEAVLCHLYIIIIMNVSRLYRRELDTLFVCVRNLTICNAHMMLEELNDDNCPIIIICNVVNAYKFACTCTCNATERRYLLSVRYAASSPPAGIKI